MPRDQNSHFCGECKIVQPLWKIFQQFLYSLFQVVTVFPVLSVSAVLGIELVSFLRLIASPSKTQLSSCQIINHCPSFYSHLLLYKCSIPDSLKILPPVLLSLSCSFQYPHSQLWYLNISASSDLVLHPVWDTDFHCHTVTPK